MSKDEEIKESLEFCNDIYRFYETEKEVNLYSQFKRKEQENSSYKNTETSSPKERKILGEEQDDLDDDIEDEELEEEEKMNFYRKELFPVLVCVILAFFTAKIISTYVIQITIVHGNSMEATVSDDDKLLVSKLNYKLEKPKRFDVIVFSKQKDQNLIKRVIGLPGEKVEIKEGIIYIDGEKLEENYGLNPLNPEADPVEMQLNKDEYFVLGDNRSVSLDSRFGAVGAVKKSEIIGEALIRLYPFNKIQCL